MRILSWNVNSVNARKERLLRYLDLHKPDVLVLQELKCEVHKFPLAEVQTLGYHTAVFGQKTYNGTAILSREPLSEIDKGLSVANFPDDARYVAASIGDLRIIDVYVPNGQDIGTPKYEYKLAWFAALKERIASELKRYPKLILGGDFNVALGDIDVHSPEQWKDKILCSEAERRALNGLLEMGLRDSFRELKPQHQEFSWWDYRQLSFQKGLGLRIDYWFVSPAIQLRDAWIDREERRGEKASDHAPVGIDIST